MNKKKEKANAIKVFNEKQDLAWKVYNEIVANARKVYDETLGKEYKIRRDATDVRD